MGWVRSMGLVVEYYDNGLIRDIFVEIKKAGGDSFIDAMEQIMYTIPPLYGANTLIPQCIYIIIARGVHIGFFEFYPQKDRLIKEGRLPSNFYETYYNEFVPLIFFKKWFSPAIYGKNGAIVIGSRVW